MKKKTGKIFEIPIIKPYFDKKEEIALAGVIKSGWVTQGPKVAEFEEMVAKYVGIKYGVATSSATTSLFLSLYMLGIGPGDEVIVPSFSFIATANVVINVGAKPIFVDIDPSTYNVDPIKIEKAITKKTKAIIPVDQIGLPCDLERINKIADKYKLHIVEDAACAFGSKYRGKRIGSISELTCFSFHPRKLITTGEGGMIMTNNKKIADRAKELRHHGMQISDLERHESKQIIHEKYGEIGFNLKMSDLEAAVGIEQLKKFPENLKRRKILAERYNKAFSGREFIVPPHVPKECDFNYQTYVVRLLPNKTVSRDGLMQKLLDVGIATRRGVMAAHLEKPYIKMFGKISLPETEKATIETMAIPLYSQMTFKEQDYVIAKILKFTKS